MIDVVSMEIGARDVAQAGGILRNFARIARDALKLVDRTAGDLAKKEGGDIEEFAGDLERAVLIGAAACEVLAKAIGEAEKDEWACDSRSDRGFGRRAHGRPNEGDLPEPE